MTNHEIQCYYHGKAMKSFMCYHDLYKPVYGRINELINFRVVWSYLNPCQISSCRYNQEKTTFTHTICPESVSLSQAPCNYLLANFLLWPSMIMAGNLRVSVKHHLVFLDQMNLF